MMKDVIDLARYPLDQPDSARYAELVECAQAKLARDGLFNFDGFLTDAAIDATLTQARPVIEAHAFAHVRNHNIWFDDDQSMVTADDPAARRRKTANHTICADQIEDSPIVQLYDWPPFAAFLARVMGKPALYPMDDRIAAANVMTYYDGCGLNWHFDRSEFTTTVLLQAPREGGVFEYVKDLRTPGDPNLEGIRDLARGAITPAVCDQVAGTLNVFKGVNTAHRVTPTKGADPRIVAVLTYYERPGAQFTPAERMGFYGRTEAWQKPA